MKTTLAFAVAVLAAMLHADEISLADASRAALNWIAMGFAPNAKGVPSIAGASTITTSEGGAYHRLAFSGGGFAVTAADDDDGPVIVYAPSGEFDFSPGSPLADVLDKRFSEVAAARNSSGSSAMAFSVSSVASSVSDSMAKERWARLLGRSSGMGTMGTGVSESSLADVRVEPLVKSKWDQS